MGVHLKQAGVWRPTQAGQLRVRQGGQWVKANKVYVKFGGQWRDSGYVGPPHTPLNFGIPAWDFSNVAVTWTAPTTGSAVSHYECAKTDQWTAPPPEAPYPTASVPSFTFSVVQDERCQLWVRSVNAYGLKSGWAGPLRVQIGHTSITHYEPYTYTEEWKSAVTPVNLFNGASAGPTVPNNVDVYGIYVNLSGTVAYQFLSHPDASPQRSILYVTQGAVRFDIGTIILNNPSNGWLYISGNGGAPPNNGWGLYATGTGYSSNGSSGNRVVGDLQVWGTATKTGYTLVYDRHRAENTTW